MQTRSDWPEVVINCLSSTQLSMKFFLIINVKMPTIVGILIFISMKNSILGLSEPIKAELLDIFTLMRILNFILRTCSRLLLMEQSDMASTLCHFICCSNDGSQHTCMFIPVTYCTYCQGVYSFCDIVRLLYISLCVCHTVCNFYFKVYVKVSH